MYGLASLPRGFLGVARQSGVRSSAFGLAFQRSDSGTATFCGTLITRLRFALPLLIVPLGTLPCCLAGFSASGRLQRNSRSPRLAQANRDRLLRRSRSVLALAHMLNLFMHEFPSGGRCGFAFPKSRLAALTVDLLGITILRNGWEVRCRSFQARCRLSLPRHEEGHLRATEPHRFNEGAGDVPGSQRCRADAGANRCEDARLARRDCAWVAARRCTGRLRGGVPMNLPLDVFIVRKLGVPGEEELVMGAVASGERWPSTRRSSITLASLPSRPGGRAAERGRSSAVNAPTATAILPSVSRTAQQFRSMMGWRPAQQCWRRRVHCVRRRSGSSWQCPYPQRAPATSSAGKWMR